MPCALVLSAGGMFGAYHAGAWNVLSRRFQPDLVVGTSAGALNGWAIAGGCSPAELLDMWRAPATGGLPVAYGVTEALRAKQVYWAEREHDSEALHFRQYLEQSPGEQVVIVDDI